MNENLKYEEAMAQLEAIVRKYRRNRCAVENRTATYQVLS